MKETFSSMASAVTLVASIAALGIPIFAPTGAVISIPWAFLEAKLGMDQTARAFLFFTAILWGSAAVYGVGYFKGQERRWVYDWFFLAAMLGNFGLIVARDAISFYVFFALMSFASYGLVVFSGDAFARRAGRIYMILVILGEVALFAGLVGIYAGTDLGETLPLGGKGLASAATMALIAVGFGVKAGVVLLHLWLPLAHPAAPVPASAVLSGAMIKAGLLGWLRFLPLGETGYQQWGVGFIVAGVVAAFFGVVVGLLQTNPKTILAYSSISQMGFMTVGVGAGMVSPEIWPLCQVAVIAYACHHAFSKGALFLGTGIAAGGLTRWAWVVLALPALALAGAPLTTGAAAKTALKSAVGKLPGDWPAMLATLLPLAAIGTALLMVRFAFVLQNHGSSGHGKQGRQPMIWSWICLVAISLAVTWLWRPISSSAESSLKAAKLWQAIWPIGVAGVLGAFVWRWRPRVLGRTVGSVPPGDLVVVGERMVRGAARFGKQLAPASFGQALARLISSLSRRRPWLTSIEEGLGRWGLAMSLFLALILIFFYVLLV